MRADGSRYAALGWHQQDAGALQCGELLACKEAKYGSVGFRGGDGFELRIVVHPSRRPALEAPVAAPTG